MSWDMSYFESFNEGVDFCLKELPLCQSTGTRRYLGGRPIENMVGVSYVDFKPIAFAELKDVSVSDLQS